MYMSVESCVLSSRLVLSSTSFLFDRDWKLKPDNAYDITDYFVSQKFIFILNAFDSQRIFICHCNIRFMTNINSIDNYVLLPRAYHYALWIIDIYHSQQCYWLSKPSSHFHAYNFNFKF